MHEGDLAMAQGIQVVQGELGRSSVVQNNVGYILEMAMPGHRNHRNRQRMFQGSVDADQTFGAFCDQLLTVFAR